MAKFCGLIGYENQSETSPGVWKSQIQERKCYGDMIQNIIRSQPSDKLNDNVSLSNRISITANSYAIKNFNLMRYVIYRGVKWKIESVEVQYPKLILSVGGVYNGQ